MKEEYVRRNRQNQRNEARSKFNDYLQKVSEFESLDKMIDSNLSGGMRSGPYTASKGGMIKAKGPGMKKGGLVGGGRQARQDRQK
jgi:hypothetical protein